MKVLFTDDGFKAFLGLKGRGTGNPLSAEVVRSILADQGIVFGIRADLEDALKSFPYESENILVAEGKNPDEGKDGWIEFAFQVKPDNLANAEEKKADFHNLGWVHNVPISGLVATVHPPQPGTPGTTLRGESVQPKPGVTAIAKLGKGVTTDPNDPSRIIATAHGNAVLDVDGTLHVEQTLKVRGNVDYSTGDINFVGSVFVAGDVKSDFSVKAAGSIEVRGNVEDANLESGGDVIINNGFIGQGKGTISAVGNVRVQHVLNQSIRSGRSIYVSREGVCATLQAAERIVAPHGVFVGCTLQAGNEVEVLNLGNGDQTQAKVRVGRRGILLDLLGQNDRDIAKVQKQLEEAKNAIYKLVRVQLDKGSLTADQQVLQNKLRIAQTELSKTVVDMQKQKEALKNQLQENSLARVIVHDTMFANVFVELNGVKKMVQGAIKEVLLTENNGKIEERPLE